MAKKQESVDVQTLVNILENLLTVPDAIKIDRKVDEMGVLVTVQVDASDMGILIGRNGVMANSIKVIMKAIGKANDMNLRVQFLEPDGSFKYDRKNDKPVKKEQKTKVTKVSKEEETKVTEQLDSDLDEFVIE